MASSTPPTTPSPPQSTVQLHQYTQQHQDQHQDQEQPLELKQQQDFPRSTFICNDGSQAIGNYIKDGSICFNNNIDNTSIDEDNLRKNKLNSSIMKQVPENDECREVITARSSYTLNDTSSTTSASMSYTNVDKISQLQQLLARRELEIEFLKMQLNRFKLIIQQNSALQQQLQLHNPLSMPIANKYDFSSYDAPQLLKQTQNIGKPIIKNDNLTTLEFYTNYVEEEEAKQEEEVEEEGTDERNIKDNTTNEKFGLLDSKQNFNVNDDDKEENGNDDDNNNSSINTINTYDIDNDDNDCGVLDAQLRASCEYFDKLDSSSDSSTTTTIDKKQQLQYEYKTISTNINIALKTECSSASSTNSVCSLGELMRNETMCDISSGNPSINKDLGIGNILGIAKDADNSQTKDISTKSVTSSSSTSSSVRQTPTRTLSPMTTNLTQIALQQTLLTPSTSTPFTASSQFNEREPPIETTNEDGLFSSLTDAIINNLSQLAALQDQCESQRQQHQQILQLQNKQQASPSQQSLHLHQHHSSPSLPLLTSPTCVSSCFSPCSSSSTSSTPSQQPNKQINNKFIRIQDQVTSTDEQALDLQPPAPTTTINSTTMTASRLVPHGTLQGQSTSALSFTSADQPQHQNHYAQQIQYQYPLGLLSYSPNLGAVGTIANRSHSSSATYNQQMHLQHLNLSQQQAQLQPQMRQSLQSTSSSSSSICEASANYISPISTLQRQLYISSVTEKMIASAKQQQNQPSLQQHQANHQQSQQQQQSLNPSTSSPLVTAGSRLSSASSGFASPPLGIKTSQLRLNNMQIKHKFGHLGQGISQFNSPHGFCLGLDQEIIVADTNNHRICIFDKNGTFIRQFGEAGKEDGQLWNPRKVVILPPPPANSPILWYNEPLFVVCDRGAERSRMQLFTRDGVYVKKIPLGFIDIVAGLAITRNGSIAAVDSVQPTVYIISVETAALGYWFDCSDHMKEPSDIAVKIESVPATYDKPKQVKSEFFICDFKGHCVVVFSEDGRCLRRIGHEFLTAYPNGIDISDDGDILVGDSHGNRFHVVVFDRNGNFVSQFECPHVKVSRCCGLKITREGHIVTLAKNNHHVLVLDTIHI